MNLHRLIDILKGPSPTFVLMHTRAPIARLISRMTAERMQPPTEWMYLHAPRLVSGIPAWRSGILAICYNLAPSLRRTWMCLLYLLMQNGFCCPTGLQHARLYRCSRRRWLGGGGGGGGVEQMWFCFFG